MAKSSPIDPADLLEVEKENAKIVNGFLASWYEPHKTDISFLVPDGAYRTNDDTPAHSPEGLIEYLKKAMGPDVRVEVTTHQTFAKGTVVLNVRTDIVKAPGRKDRIFEIVGEFTVKNGKIVEWTDHVYTWKEAS
jgi:limonene-1,2-epoxide hydrolase